MAYVTENYNKGILTDYLRLKTLCKCSYYINIINYGF